jgi:hypothetical protein
MMRSLFKKIRNESRMYAEDRKLIGVIEKEEDAIEIQKDIDNMQHMGPISSF